MASSFSKSATSGNDQFAKTPASMYILFEKLMGIPKEEWFDVCPPDPTFDGLNVPWKSPAFCNPPFKDLQSWFNKAIAEHRRDDVFTLILFPFRTATRYMHHHILQKRAVTKIFSITTRVRFESYKKDFPLPIALMCIGKPTPTPIPPSLAVISVPTYLVSFMSARVTMEHDVLPTFREVYAFPHETITGIVPSKMVPSAIMCLTSNLTRDVACIVKLLERETSIDYILLMIPALLNGLAFRTILPYVKRIYLISPQVSLDSENLNKKSFLGTIGVLLSIRSAPPAGNHISVPGYVAFHRIASCPDLDFVMET